MDGEEVNWFRVRRGFFLAIVKFKRDSKSDICTWHLDFFKLDKDVVYGDIAVCSAAVFAYTITILHIQSFLSDNDFYLLGNKS